MTNQVLNKFRNDKELLTRNRKFGCGSAIDSVH